MTNSGVKKIKKYLESVSDGSVSIEDYRKVDSKWTKRTLQRIATDNLDIFQLENGKVSLIKKNNDINDYAKTRTDITKELERFLVGPFTETEELGWNRRPMGVYLSGKLAPFGSSSQVVNEEEVEVQTNQLIEDEKVDEHLSNRDVFRPSSLGFSFKMKELTPIEIKASWGMYR